MSNRKRIIFILGGKGGTGKTLHCHTLYYFLLTSGVKAVGFDTDIENPEFMKYHANSAHPVRKIDFLQTGQAKELFSLIEEETPDVALIDMPGASAQGTRDQLDHFGAFDIAEGLGYRITIDTVINNNYNSIASLLAMIQHSKDQADYVVVKNLLFAQGVLNFQRWSNSATRKELLKLKGVELEMPLFESSTVDAMQEQTISLFDKGKLKFGDRILVDSFLNKSRAELTKAATLLGLPWESELETKRSKSRSKKEFASETELPEEVDSAEQQQVVEAGSGS